MFYLEANDIAAIAAEFHADEVDRLTQSPVLVRIALGLESCHGLTGILHPATICDSWKV